MTLTQPTKTLSPGTVERIEPGPAELDEVAFARRRRRTDNVLRWGTPLLLLVLWQIAGWQEVIDRRYWPSPSDCFAAGRELIDTGALQDATIATVRRILIGYVIGCSSGIAIGLLLGAFRTLRVAFEPIIHALYTVPKLALLPLLLLVFGIGEAPTIILIAITVFFVVAISTTAGVHAVPKAYIDASKSLGGTRRELFRHVIVPASLPSMIVALRLSAGIAVLVVIGVEFVYGGDGLGHLIWNSWQLFIADRMYVGIIVVAVIGVLFQAAVAYLGKRLAPWAEIDGIVEI